MTRDARLAWDTPRLASALTYWEGFDAASGGRTMFVPALGPDATAGHVWNRRSLDLFDRFVATADPLGRTRGEHVSVDVRRSYVAAIRLLRCREAGYDVAPEDVNFTAPLVAKTAKRKEPALCATRKLSLGLRAMHLLAAASAGFDRSSTQGVIEWGAAVVAHNTLLRGGEVGEPDDTAGQRHRVLRVSSFRWQPAGRASQGRMWLIVWIVPIKDPTGASRGYPTPVCRRHDGAFGADPLCPYDAAAAVWWHRMRPGTPLPVDVSGRPLDGWWRIAAAPGYLSAPMFTTAHGEPWRTSHSRQLAQRIARLAGLDEREVGAKAFRIGGSTDCRELTGEAGKALIKRRGRWASDVAEIYQRELASAQLALSAGIGDATGVGLEEVCAGWAQAG